MRKNVGIKYMFCIVCDMEKSNEICYGGIIKIADSNGGRGYEFT